MDFSESQNRFAVLNPNAHTELHVGQRCAVPEPAGAKRTHLLQHNKNACKQLPSQTGSAMQCNQPLCFAWCSARIWGPDQWETSAATSDSL